MNNLPFELFVAVRYLLARRKQAFISLISLISTLGVAVGVMALLIALALMTGLQGELRDRIVGSSAHIFVHKVGGYSDYTQDMEKLRQMPRVRAAAPVIQGLGMISGGSGTGFVKIKGILPELEAQVTEVEKAIKSGSLAALAPVEGEMSGIVIGRELATQIGSFVGDRVELLAPEGGSLSPIGLMPARRAFKVVGLFSLGLYEFDQGYAFVHLNSAKRLAGHDSIDFIELRVDDMFAAGEIADDIGNQIGDEYMPQDWSDLNQSLFSALALEKLAISITIGLIVMVAALNIVASLVLLVMEKSRDIAILKTMGSSAASIRRIFMLQGLVIGLIGTTVGAIAGGVVIYIVDKYKLVSVPLDVYQISHVPFRLEVFDFVVVIASAIVICFLATIYPSRQAAKLDPAQALRYQ
ncbi:MAG: lipoprotein-releasing ABC transporter permease subunit [Acidobacteriota bacterium]|nr:lipoprotein-releasing ABC transporter permease subunit [Acidobacteriota bacterium]MDQ3420204.1 lipoprotein-releasing ABC transporter permease subunit [Acidobacteriota bacterium]